MPNEIVTELNDVLATRATVRANITAYVEANIDTFLPYLEMIGAHDDLTLRATHLAKQLCAEDVKDVATTGNAKFKKSSTSDVDVDALAAAAGKDVFANYPGLVKSLDLTRVAILFPEVLRDPKNVREVSTGALRDLLKSGAVPTAAGAKAITNRTSYTLSGLEPFGSG